MLRFLLISWLAVFSFHSFKDDLDLAELEGWVRDPASRPIADATIRVVNQSSRRSQTCLTDSKGHFRITGLQPGHHLINVFSQGFRPRSSTLYLGAGSSLRLNLTLELPSIQSEVEIVERTNPIQQTSFGSSIEGLLVSQLPLFTTDTYELAITSSGVAPRPFDDRELAVGDHNDRFLSTPEEAGKLSIGGGPAYSNNLTLEGLDNNDDRAARERFIPIRESVEELQVTRHQFSAEYGRASGGRINARLRSGTNQFHGKAYDSFADESLNANSWNRNSDPGRGFRLPYQDNSPGMDLAGPVIKNRLLYFVGAEYNRISDQADIRALVPVQASALFPVVTPTGQNLGHVSLSSLPKQLILNGGADVGTFDARLSTPRVSLRINSRIDLTSIPGHLVYLVFTAAHEADRSGFPGGERLPETMRQAGRDNRAISVSDYGLLSKSVSLQTRFQVSGLYPQDSPGNSIPVVLISVTDPREGVSGYISRSGTLVAGSSNSSATVRSERRLQLQEIVTAAGTGKTFLGGLDLQLINSSYRNLADTTGTFRFGNVADFLEGRYSRFTQRFNTFSRLRNSYLGGFLQEEWRPATSFLISTGLRWERESLVGGNHNFGPRLALAWSPGVSGRLVVRGGAGIFYNRALLRTLDDFAITSGAVTLDSEIAPQLFSTLKFPLPVRADDGLVTQFGVSDSGFLRRLETDLKLPGSYQTAVGVTFGLPRQGSLEINAVINRGLHLWRESNINAPRLPNGVSDFAEYLQSRSFDNRIDPLTGLRPISSTGNADQVRFDSSAQSFTVNKSLSGNTVVFGLNNSSTSNATAAIKAALAAVRNLRPNPNLTQVEEIQSRGRSSYAGLHVTYRGELVANLKAHLSYTLSRAVDDGSLNTSSPLVPGNFSRELALSLTHARHRLSSHFLYLAPRRLGGAELSSLFLYSSGSPFNVGIGGNDRNLDDVGTDRPNFIGDSKQIKWVQPGQAVAPEIFSGFSLPIIGTAGNLPRNVGKGPARWTLSARLSRTFRFREGDRLLGYVEVYNPTNSTVFSYGAEYVDYSPTTSATFLQPVRTLKPRNFRLGAKYSF